MRLLVHVEGQTEENFVNDVLRDHLVSKGYEAVSARIVGNAGVGRGGIRSWPSVRREIMNSLKSDPGCIATTMVDYYGLPQDGEKAWPGRADAPQVKPIERAACVEDALAANLIATMGRRFDPRRFVPFVVMHEFEALLFSDCAALSRAIGRPDLESGFRAIRSQFATPEEIDDSVQTAPSKRIGAVLKSDYEKPVLGVLAVLEIGLPRIRAECPHFADWLNRLESLVG